MMKVRIPLRNREFFNLYANGEVLDAFRDGERGTILSFEGVVVLQYKWPSRRTAYIVCEQRLAPFMRAESLPCVYGSCAVISKLYGRRIDRLRTAIYNLEKLKGKGAYSLPVPFWQRFACILSDGSRGGSSKSRVRRLADLYSGRSFDAEGDKRGS